MKKLSYFLFGLGMVATFFYAAGYRVNLTSSFPLGIWQADAGLIRKGDYVLFCPPEDNEAVNFARQAGYFAIGVCHGYMPLLKKVVALAGDMVIIDHDVAVNGEHVSNSALLTVDSAGRTLPAAKTGVVPDGQFLPMSDFSGRSFDGRYFGTINLAAVEYRMIPLWLWQ